MANASAKLSDPGFNEFNLIIGDLVLNPQLINLDMPDFPNPLSICYSVCRAGFGLDYDPTLPPKYVNLLLIPRPMHAPFIVP